MKKKFSIHKVKVLYQGNKCPYTKSKLSRGLKRGVPFIAKEQNREKDERMNDVQKADEKGL